MTPHDPGIFVQYGAGFCAPEGWRNYDASPTLFAERLPLIGHFVKKNAERFPANVAWGDVVKGLPIHAGTADGVYCSHVLEHLSLADCRTALANTLTMLRPGGIFRLVVPDLKRLAEGYLKATRAGDAGAAYRFIQSTGMGDEIRPRGFAGSLVSFFGNSRHRWMWDVPAVMEELQAAGFVAIRKCAFGDCEVPAFAAVEEYDRFVSGEGDPEVCLEARKPGT